MNTSTVREYPFYIKTTVILLGLVLLTYSLGSLRQVLVPPAFALLLAILLNPLVNRLMKWRNSKVLSISISLLLTTIVLGGVGYFIYSQISNFSGELPLFKKKFTELFQHVREYAANRFSLGEKRQEELIAQAESSITPMIGTTIGNLASTVGVLILLPIYTFLFLYYKNLLLNFLYEVFAEKNSDNVETILAETKTTTQQYTLGLLVEALIVATMNSIVMLILGIDYAVLLGILGAVLNMLPFIGGLMSAGLPLIVATVTKEGYQTQVWIMICYLAIQFIDNHLLMPYIVSSRVKINALTSIIGVLLGGALWGIPGMFLSIPFIGILKIIFDRVPDLKPWGKLLGDIAPTRHKGELWHRLRARKSKNKESDPSAKKDKKS